MKNLSKQYSSQHPKKNGSALVICIWMLIFFSILSVGVYRTVSAQISLSTAVENRAIGPYLANGAYFDAKKELKNDTDTYDTLNKLRKAREKELGSGKYSYMFMDEESRININSASLNVIKQLPGLNQPLAQAIIASRPFKYKEALLLVDGITKEIFDQVRDYITVYSDGSINVNTASVEVLNATGLNGSAINNFRMGRDNKECTADDNAFVTIDAFRKMFDTTGITVVLTVKSKSFSIRTETKVVNKNAATYIIAMNENGAIRQWLEY